MSEDVKSVNQDDKKQTDSGSDNTTAVTQDDKKSNMIPQARFDEVNSKYRTLQEKFDNMNETIKQNEQQKEIKAGNLEKVIEQLNLEKKELTGQLEKTSNNYTALESSVRNEYLAKIPEDKREKYEKYPVEAVKDIAEAFTSNTQGNSVKVDNSNPTRKPTGDMGGYNSWEEFAVKDPKGAEKAIADSTSQFIK